MGFNGAATVRSRIGRPGTRARLHHLGFNGAATVRSRIGCRDCPLRPFCRGFNGAATVRSRIAEDDAVDDDMELMVLQWGRDRQVADR